jgi:hypothetical protein
LGSEKALLIIGGETRFTVTLLWFDVTVPTPASFAVAVASLVTAFALTSSAVTVYVLAQLALAPGAKLVTPPQLNGVGLPKWSSVTSNGAYNGTSPVLVKV